jgi:hypothetical protein
MHLPAFSMLALSLDFFSFGSGKGIPPVVGRVVCRLLTNMLRQLLSQQVNKPWCAHLGSQQSKEMQQFLLKHKASPLIVTVVVTT